MVNFAKHFLFLSEFWNILNLGAVSSKKVKKKQQMDTWLPLIKAWKQDDIKKPYKLLKKKFESSFTFDTFKLFFHQKKLARFQIRP